MTTSFSELKRGGKSLYDKIVEETNKHNSGGYDRDERLWSPETDKAGNGYAVIRFLPPSKGETVPFVRIFSHGFQGKGGWYIENSLSTLNQNDPCGEYNSVLWNRGDDAGKEQARAQKRKLSYYANVYILKDPAHPENEGKVFIYRFGKKIYDKLNDLMHPEFDDEAPINPYDLWEGANFKLKIRKVEGWPNYDKSEFDAAGPLLNDDAVLETVWESQYALQELLDPKNFKSYPELAAKLARALGPAGNTRTAEQEEVAPVAARSKPATETAKTELAPWADDDDDSLAFFKTLANE